MPGYGNVRSEQQRGAGPHPSTSDQPRSPETTRSSAAVLLTSYAIFYTGSNRLKPSSARRVTTDRPKAVYVGWPTGCL